ncbi:MAG: thioredoxin [Euryarchaeota archaeon]|nr:thioredoxin [Euryarchaeota archaeon]
MAGTVLELDPTSFGEALEQGDRLVVVEFYTDTCPNCAALRPVYEALSAEMGAEARFTRLNAAAHATLAARFGIMGVPTIKFFCRGRPIGDIVGEVNTTVLRNTIKDFIRHRTECVSRSTAIRTEMDGYG